MFVCKPNWLIIILLLPMCIHHLTPNGFRDSAFFHFCCCSLAFSTKDIENPIFDFCINSKCLLFLSLSNIGNDHQVYRGNVQYLKIGFEMDDSATELNFLILGDTNWIGRNPIHSISQKCIRPSQFCRYSFLSFHETELQKWALTQ